MILGFREENIPLRQSNGVDVIVAIVQIPVEGMWPPRMYEYKAQGHINLLLNMFRLTYDVAKDSNAAVSELASTAAKLLTGMTQELIKSWTASKHTLMNRAERLESACDFLEVSF